MSKKLPIFYSALLLTLVNLLLRFVGTSFQVFLSGKIGAEGIGLLQLVLSIGSMGLVAGMAGIRTASMYLTAEEYGRHSRHNIPCVTSGCIVYSVLCSAAVGAVIFLFAPMLSSEWIGNAATANCLRTIAVFLPVNCLTGVMVGSFTGSNRIGTLAAVEIAEQGCTMVCTVSLLTFWAGHDIERCCQAVILGSCMGSCLTLTALVILRLAEKIPCGMTIPVRKRLLNTAVPLALADDLRTGISTVENLMVPKRLALFPGSISPLAAFGTVCGMVFPILMFPCAILFGLTELLVPELARCNAAGSKERICHLAQKSLRVAMLYGIFCSGILYLCADELCRTLYHSEDAGVYLRWFSVLAVMLYCDAVTDAMIKGLGQQKASVRYNILTNTMDVIGLYLMLPRLGILGYFISFTVTHVINFGLSIRRLLKITKLSLDIPKIGLALGSALGAVLICRNISSPLPRIASYIAVLSCLLYLLGIVRQDDISWFRGLLYKRKES